jgi:hypothetical protein
MCAGPPIRILKVWPDKNKFVEAAIRIERHMEDPLHAYQKTNEGLFRVMYGRCKESSQFEPHITWGCRTYVDFERKMKWPSGYVSHYIAKWNVMPTQAFFQYVLYRIAHPFPGFGTTPMATGPSSSGVGLKPMKPVYMAAPKTFKSCPPNKIVNPETGRCVLVTGKIGRRILARR